MSGWSRAVTRLGVLVALAFAAAVGISLATKHSFAIEIGTAIFLAGGLLMLLAGLPMLGAFNTTAALPTIWAAGGKPDLARSISDTAFADTRRTVPFTVLFLVAGLLLVAAGLVIALAA